MWLSISPDCYSLHYYVYNVVVRVTNKTPRNTKDELTARITAAFNHLNKETIGKACKRFRRRLETMVKWGFLWINLVYSISGYFLIILVNISDKVRWLYYFHFCKISATHTHIHTPHAVYMCVYIYIYICVCVYPPLNIRKNYREYVLSNSAFKKK